MYPVIINQSNPKPTALREMSERTYLHKGQCWAIPSKRKEYTPSGDIQFVVVNKREQAIMCRNDGRIVGQGERLPITGITMGNPLLCVELVQEGICITHLYIMRGADVIHLVWDDGKEGFGYRGNTKNLPPVYRHLEQALYRHFIPNYLTSNTSSPADLSQRNLSNIRSFIKKNSHTVLDQVTPQNMHRLDYLMGSM